MIEIKKIFGWNAKAFYVPFKAALNDHPILEGAEILEIGAGSFSSVALYFANSNCKLNITTYPTEHLPGLENLVIDFINKKKEMPNIFCMSVKDVVGTYDLIIMKSVLGGIFRTDSSSKENVEPLILEIVSNNLKPGGVLITIDNGATILEKLFSKFGARANQWRFFLPDDFKKNTKQYHFGFFTNFSFVTRFGKFGEIIEDFVFFIDCLVYKAFKISRPSVIVTVYKR